MSQPEQQPDRFERAYKREKLARRQAEELLERRSRELYEANQRIERRSQSLEEALDKLKLAQTQLVQSEKMASVGQLAAGIAHEINNPVAFIASNLNSLKSYTETLGELIRGYEKLTTAYADGDSAAIEASAASVSALRKAEDVDFLFEDITDIVEESSAGTRRVIEIVQGLKNFSRLDENELKGASINEGIESTLKIASNELKYKCEVETELEEIPLVLCYAGQINQVILNLLVNAAQASDDGGKIVIRTYQRSEFACIDVEDAGCGIDEDNLASIFNPFFTTKDVGEGTGLGLSISYAIIEKHGGTIEVASEVGVGTKFTISIPFNGPSEEAA